MASAVPKQAAPLVLVCGEDEFTVKQRAKHLYVQWCQEVGGSDHEVIDGSVSNSGEALKALARLREATGPQAEPASEPVASRGGERGNSASEPVASRGGERGNSAGEPVASRGGERGNSAGRSGGARDD